MVRRVPFLHLHFKYYESDSITVKTNTWDYISSENGWVVKHPANLQTVHFFECNFMFDFYNFNSYNFNSYRISGKFSSFSCPLPVISNPLFS